MSQDILYSRLGGETQREEQSGYVTREKQKEQIQHVLSIGLPLLPDQGRHDLAWDFVRNPIVGV
jgi:hypothetical protein